MDWKNQFKKTRSWFVGGAFGILLLVFLMPMLVLLFLLTDQGGFFSPGFFCGSDGMKPYCYQWVSDQYPYAPDKSNAVAWSDPEGGDGYCLNLGETPTSECWSFSRNINMVVSLIIIIGGAFLVGAGITWFLKSLIDLFRK